MPNLTSLAWRLAVSGSAGIALALSFPPYDITFPLLPIGVAALTLAVRGASLRLAALCGLVTGLVFFLLLLHWLSAVGNDAWLAAAAICGAYIAALGAASALITRLAWWPIWVACLWVVQEAARDRFPVGGFPWGRLAFGDEGFFFTPYAALGGAPLVTFLTALCGALLAWAMVNLRGRTLAAVGALIAVALLPAAAAVIPTPTRGRSVTVAVVQGNVPRAGLDFAGQRQAVLNNHVVATLKLAADVKAGKKPKPDVVIWPENSSDLDPFIDPSARRAIDRAVSAVGVPVLVGAVVNTRDRKNVVNAGYVWDPVTGPGMRYTKRHLVPFGEYIPFRGLLGERITRLGRISKDFLPGSAPGVLKLGAATIGDVICFEVAYDGIVRDAVNNGGAVIVVQTNNATYGHTGQPQQQALMSRVRAVEHGRPVLVAATSGVSEIVAADGRVTASTSEFTQQVIVQKVKLRTGRTLADRVGDRPEILLTIVGLAAVVFAVARRRTTSKAGTTASEQA